MIDQVALENPKKITVEMISRQAGMSRENIYHNHFRGVQEIIEKVHFLINNGIYLKFKEFIESGNPNILDFLSKSMLPFLYEKRG